MVTNLRLRLSLLRASLIMIAASGGIASAQSHVAPAGITVEVYLSSVGAGLLAMPREVLAAMKTANPALALNSLDAGAGSHGWYLRGYMASPSVVNLGAMNLSWVRGGFGGQSAVSDVIGVKLGTLNASAPLVCDGTRRVVLQLDAQGGDYSARLSRLGAQSDTTAARIEYTCG